MKPSLNYSIHRRIGQIASGNFRCDDIKLLYVEIRDFSSNGCITREIGDYMAHPREKDRGLSHKRATEQYAAFRRMGDLLSGRLPGESDIIHVKPAFTGAEIVTDLVSQLVANGFATAQAITAHSIAIELCVISLLQDAVIRINSHIKVQAAVGFDNRQIRLNAAYVIDYNGRDAAVAAPIIEGSYQNDEIGPGTKCILPGNAFTVSVIDGRPLMVFA
jgi:hypothetical protein